MFYHRVLQSIRYKPQALAEILEYGQTSSQWTSGYDKNGFQWNVEELPIPYERFPILAEIFDNLQLEFKRKSFYLSKVLPGGLQNHIDHRKWGNLALPIVGPFENSPLLFLDAFNNIVEKVHFQTNNDGTFHPVAFNTRMIHAVPLSKEQQEDRIVLMLDLFDWPESIFQNVDQNNFWQPSSNFYSLT